jgi:plastocyanin
MKRWPIVTVIALAMSVRAVSLMSQVEAAGTSSASAATTTAPATVPATESLVEIDNFVFKPKELTVAVGAKVTWVNKDDVPHTATSSDDPRVFDSKTLDTDDKYSFTFTKPGTYKYFCKVHPHMTGVVIVK